MPQLASDIADHAALHEKRAVSLATALALTWTYDPVYYAMEASMDENELPRIVEALEASFDHQLNATSHRQTQDAVVTDLVSWAGGLQRKQRLFFTTPDVTTFFAMLWPWTEESGCTLRLGLFSSQIGMADRAPLADIFRGWIETPKNNRTG